MILKSLVTFLPYCSFSFCSDFKRLTDSHDLVCQVAFNVVFHFCYSRMNQKTEKRSCCPQNWRFEYIRIRTGKKGKEEQQLLLLDFLLYVYLHMQPLTVSGFVKLNYYYCLFLTTSIELIYSFWSVFYPDILHVF